MQFFFSYSVSAHGSLCVSVAAVAFVVLSAILVVAVVIVVVDLEVIVDFAVVVFVVLLEDWLLVA